MVRTEPIAALFVGFALLACAPKPQPDTAPPVPTPAGEALEPEAAAALFDGDYTSLAGSWDSEYGTVQLMFDDNLHFSGIYRDGEFVGHVEVETSTLVFEWGDDGSVGRGVWEIIDEDTLRGSWGIDASSTNGGEWTLVR